MSAKDSTEMSRENIKAAREAKKLAKQKAKGKKGDVSTPTNVPDKENKDCAQKTTTDNTTQNTKIVKQNEATAKRSESVDEVDKAVPKAEKIKSSTSIIAKVDSVVKKQGDKTTPVTDMTVKDIVNTLKDIVDIAKEVENVTARIEAIDFGAKKAKPIAEESAKSKAELKAERRAKQEAQRAAKQAAAEKVAGKEKKKDEVDKKEEKVAKSKPVEKPKAKTMSAQKMNWFGRNPLVEHNREEALKNIALNSNMHPSIVKLGVQLATHVVTGANAKCVALLDALKKVIRDYSLPARTEFGRGLEAQLSRCAEYLWALRPPAAAQLTALSHLRRYLTQLPADVHEFDAKKKLQEEIDRYIREQIDMAGEAISIAVRQKISDGDSILTYGCSSLIERILCDAHAAGADFTAVVAGSRSAPAREMLRRLLARGVCTVYVDVASLGSYMRQVSKVVLGCESLLANGAVLARAGSLGVALAARARNVPVLVACETHKFSDRVHTDTIACAECGDPDDLIDKTDENSPLKDWKSNPNLNVFNLMYDVTPSSLVTAVVTELAILPCTSAPVVLRYKMSEYGI
ncbi:translation initiation factor eIF-2B subunit delta isoform X2 [Aricia agestis]|uniref:translation initiation factor eIF-2B subunit delta isoform X2 n=1 Tax=Aricia agestis TaxID=91739 RepID=UPI001C20B316|nr:translation initiation factor eIF-2B subunit delta isoform X2 [Aricia agestis]XP_041975851.1 translation initiation factor eIF-2B subunit delta isoform X2 [Aricia agestis]XP_041975852.1 translation initiation factor eIF-2B subunit delta isoform X2 [Aricia agestis]